MTKLSVMHLVDSLDAGGTERVAVNISNQLAQRGHKAFLCTTRRDGPLSNLVSDDVGRLSLNRTRTLQFSALRRLMRYIKEHDIRLLHAHGSSILTANLVSRCPPYPTLVWHDHFGTNQQKERPVWLYRWLVARAGGTVAVSDPLADWARRKLRVPASRVWCLPNFVDSTASSEPQRVSLKLPGEDGSRIVCVANLRPVKDHETLLSAIRQVVDQRPEAHLMLVGATSDQACVNRIQDKIKRNELSDHVTILGPRDDVPSILAGSDIGVLSSTSEGLPMSLLEYGAAGLAVVVTDVGQCGSTVGDTGRVVPPESPDLMAEAVLSFLKDEDARRDAGRRFQQRVRDHFGADHVMERLLEIYAKLLGAA